MSVEPILVRPTAAGGTTSFVAEVSWASNTPSIPTKMPFAISRDQLYFWTELWQREEEAALDDLANGRSRVFSEPSDAARWLLDTEDDV